MACCCRTPKSRLISLVTVGALVLIVGCACIPFFQWFIQDQIKKNVAIVPGSQTYDNFIEPTPPIYMQYYVFNVTNPEEVTTGTKKPSVTQLGPYTYREYRKKINVKHNDNGTITYEQRKWYKFVREKSAGSDNDTFISLNLVLLTLANAMKNEPQVVQRLVSIVADIQKETLFVNKTIREIVWGYNDTVLQMASLLAPKWFTTALVGTMAGKNDSTDGVYTVYTGTTDSNLLGTIDKWNGSSTLTYWTAPQANMINGTDGTLCPPFITKDVVLPTFSTDICRSVYGVYSGDELSPQGVKLWRFSGNSSVLASGRVNPANLGFCVPAGNCLPSGVFPLTSCQFEDGFPLPIYISQPHFYEGDASLREAVNGMKPDPVKHRVDIDVEPNTGIIMKAAKRLQINTYLEPSNFSFGHLAKVKKIYFPILYLDENFVIDDKNANMFKSHVQVPMIIAQVVQYALIGIGLILLILALAYGISVYHKPSSETFVKEPPGDSDEHSPLLRDAADA